MGLARDVFDRHARLLEVGDVEGVLGQHHEDAVLVRADRVVEGRAALRELYAAEVAQGVRVVELLQVAESADALGYQAVLEVGGQEVRAHGALVLRGERIWRHVTGLFPQASGAARGRAQVTVDLEPYTSWAPRPVPDPRTAGREAIGPVLLELVAAEGPVLAERAYRLYVRASGGKALTSIARAPLSGAAHRLRMAGAIEFDEQAGPEVLLRELGSRALDEVPPGELDELVRRLAAAGATDLPRAVLDAYGLVRMTAKAEALLTAAVARAQEVV
jgi:hypothetical protein